MEDLEEMPELKKKIDSWIAEKLSTKKEKVNFANDTMKEDEDDEEESIFAEVIEKDDKPGGSFLGGF